MLYVVVAGITVIAASLFHLRSPLLELAVSVTLPWSFGYGFFVWSALHGLEYELVIYLVACLGLNAALVFWIERRWRRSRRTTPPEDARSDRGG